MPKYESASRPPKTFKVEHAEPGALRKGYILLPIGYNYNSEWETAKKGDTLKLWNGGSYTIFAIRKLSLKRAGADILCQMRYGITIKRAIQIWQDNARLEGHGLKAVSTDECLWIIYDIE